jgi:hypothetical protein
VAGGEAIEGVDKFPGEIVGVHHGDVHSLAGFGTVCVASLDMSVKFLHTESSRTIADDEHSIHTLRVLLRELF